MAKKSKPESEPTEQKEVKEKKTTKTAKVVPLNKEEKAEKPKPEKKKAEPKKKSALATEIAQLVEPEPAPEEPTPAAEPEQSPEDQGVTVFTIEETPEVPGENQASEEEKGPVQPETGPAENPPVEPGKKVSKSKKVEKTEKSVPAKKAKSKYVQISLLPDQVPDQDVANEADKKPRGRRKNSDLDNVVTPEQEARRDKIISLLRTNNALLNLMEIARRAIGTEGKIANFQEMVSGRRRMPARYIDPLFVYLSARFPHLSGDFAPSNNQVAVQTVEVPAEPIKTQPVQNEGFEYDFLIHAPRPDTITISGKGVEYLFSPRKSELLVNGELSTNFALVQKLKIVADTFMKIEKDLEHGI